MIAAPRQPRAVEIFFSYAREDEDCRVRLEKHLSTLRNEGLVADWHDRMIEPGVAWDEEIRDRLRRADIVLLLLSADFLASEYATRVEMEEAFARHRAGEARVVPVVVQPCDWRATELAELNALPRDGLPIASWSNAEDAYLDVARGIRRAAEGIREQWDDQADRAPAPPGARKRVVVVATALTATEDVDEGRLLPALADAAQTLTNHFTEHGATVQSANPGDLIAVFGLPRLAGDDALRAARAACGVHECLGRAEADLRSRYGVAIRARVAVEAGAAHVDETEGTASLAWAVATRAERLAARAEDGETLLAAAVHAAVRHAVRTATPADGYPGAQRVLGVLPDAPARPLRPRSPVVGREREAVMLHSTFDRALADRTCHLFALLGPPGIGKSRLALEFTRRVADRAVVLRGACSDAGPALWPLLEIIRQAAAIESADPPDRVLEKLTSLVGDEPDAAVVAAAVAGLLDLGEPSADIDAGTGAVRRLVEAMASRIPLVLVLDDVQEAKPALISLIRFVAEQTSGAPLFILCLAWPEVDDRQPGWDDGIRNAIRIHLEPLPADATNRLIENLLGTDVDENLLRRVAEAADGNPLYVEESIAMLVERACIEPRDGVWRAVGDLPSDLFPDTVDDVVAARIDQLSPDERAVVRAAAVEGMRFHERAVGALTGPAVSSQLPAVLAALARKDVIRRDRADLPGGDGYAFRHVVIREAAYESLATQRRAELHRDYAAWVEEVTGGPLPEYEEIVGFHLERAHALWQEVLGPGAEGLDDLADRASALLASAGRRAIARGVMSGAHELLERAHALAGERSEPALLLDLAVVLMERGRLEEALERYEAAIDAASAAGEVRVEWYARIQRSGLLRDLRPDEMSTAELEREAKDALLTFTELGDELGLAKYWHRQGYVASERCRWRAAQEGFQRARRHARRAGADRDEAVASAMLFYCFVLGPAHVDSAIRRSDRILADGRFRSVEGVGRAALANLHAMRGDFDEVRELLVESREILDDLGQTRRRLEAALFAASAELLAGNAEEAAEQLRWAYEAAAAMGQTGLAASHGAHLAEALYALERFDEADAAAVAACRSAASDDVFTQVKWRAVHAKVLARRRDPGAAAEAHRAVEFAATMDDLNSHAAALADLAEVLRATGFAEDADTAAAEARDLYRSKGNVVGAQRLEALPLQQISTRRA